MTDASLKPARSRFSRLGPIIVLAATVGVLIAVGSQHSPAVWAAYVSSLKINPHGPDLALLAEQPLVIKLHIAAALVALGIGIVQLIGVKGTGVHRVLGWTWVAAMATTAVSSLFIRGLNHGSFSFIHLLSGWVIIALPMALFAVRRGNIRMHARFMTGLFVGGLVIAGLLTFIPGRLMWRAFFG
jgi:uncharacterized membrane protein